MKQIEHGVNPASSLYFSRFGIFINQLAIRSGRLAVAMGNDRHRRLREYRPDRVSHRQNLAGNGACIRNCVVPDGVVADSEG